MRTKVQIFYFATDNPHDMENEINSWVENNNARIISASPVMLGDVVYVFVVYEN